MENSTEGKPTWNGQDVIVKDDGTWWLSNDPAPKQALTRNDAEEVLKKDKAFKNPYGRLVLRELMGTLQYVRADEHTHRNYEYQSWLSQKGIADITGMDRNTVRKYINTLVKDGYLIPGNVRIKEHKPVQAYWFGAGKATPRDLSLLTADERKSLGDLTSNGKWTGNSSNLKRTIKADKAEANFKKLMENREGEGTFADDVHTGYADDVHTGYADDVHTGYADDVHTGFADDVRINNQMEHPEDNTQREEPESATSSAGASEVSHDPSNEGVKGRHQKQEPSANSGETPKNPKDPGTPNEQQGDPYADDVRKGTDHVSPDDRWSKNPGPHDKQAWAAKAREAGIYEDYDEELFWADTAKQAYETALKLNPGVGA